MKLLASLVAAATADYACCPYDEFGVVFSGCPLTEKTPWAIDSNNADPHGVEHHMCKAWEANIDATFEGNYNPDGDNDDWGGCGFQRHFPWNTGTAKHDEAVTQSTLHCKLGVFDCSNLSNPQNKYRSLITAPGFGFSLETSGFGASNTNHVFGQVTLGGVCKLWIPVHRQHIDSVHVAGVHVRGGGEFITGETSNRISVFNGARVSGTAIPATDLSTISDGATGTAYCFSVVNIAEFTENNMPDSAFQVMNGNVAGKETGGMDMHLLQGRQDGHPLNPDYDNDGTNDDGQYPINFGDTLPFSDGLGTIVEGGANFDVVVHFKSDWCIRHWTIVDMQAWDGAAADKNHGDHGSLRHDYEIADVDPAHHQHTDAFDKRFDAATVGICGCGPADGTDERYASASRADVSGLNLAAKGCQAASGSSLDGCVHTQNAYTAQVATLASNTGLSYYWPNAGAWAAFFSFVTCSDDDFMIYEIPTLTDGTKGDETIAHSENADHLKMANRMVVHSMFYNDIRHDYSDVNGAEHLTGNVNIRGNIRQVGRDVKYCAPGWMNWDSETDSRGDTAPPGGMSSNAGKNDGFKRCTWNWNFNGNALTGSDAETQGINDRDPETWFKGEETGHGSTTTNGKGPFGQFRPWGNTLNPVQAVIGNGQDEIDRFDDALNGFGNLIYPVVQEIDFNLKFRHETASTTVAAGPSNPHAPAEDSTNIDYKLSVDASKYIFGNGVQGETTKNGIGQADAGHSFSFTLRCLLSSLDGNGAFIANQGVATQTKDDITNSNSNIHVKDMWPDCYMGDEIHFNYKITMGAPSSETTEHRINAWDTEITTSDSLFWPQ